MYLSTPIVVASLGLVLVGWKGSECTQGRPLGGTWRVTLMLDSAKLLEGSPKGDTVKGSITLGPAFRTFSMHPTVDTVGAVFGTHDLDFRLFWGGPIPPEYSTSILGPGTSSPITEVFVPSYRDVVLITLNPRFSHGSIDLRGRPEGDSLIAGTWLLHGEVSRAAGHFLMVRAR